MGREKKVEKMSDKLQHVGKEPVQNKAMKKAQRKGVTAASLNAVKSFNSCAGNFFSISPVAYQGRTKGMWTITDRSDVHPNCIYASNPYHKCAEYCFKNVPNRDLPGQVMNLKSLEGDEIFSIRGRTSLQPQCIYASDTQHECTEICLQNGPDSNTREGESKDGKKETSYVLRRDAEAKCKVASNPFHECSEYCSEGHPDKNQPVECISVIIKEKKRSSPSEKKDHLIMQKSTVNLEFIEASKPIYNNVESTAVIILPDRIEKSCMDSKFVEASTPHSDDTEFSERITMQVVTTDLMPEVETKITKEPSDVQPLELDASNLFLEWAKYCSQERAAENKIVMQVERTAFEAKNGQEIDNLKYHDSSNLEKVKAEGRLQRFLPTSVLFFLAFLCAIFKWTEMIHSFVMSSEKKKSGGRVIHIRHVESK